MALPSTREDLSFQERVFVTIEKRDAGNQVDFASHMDEVGFDDGNKDFDQTALQNGGFHRTRTVEEPTSFTGEAFVGGPQTNAGDSQKEVEGISEYFYEETGPDHNPSEGVYQFHNGTLSRSKFRITVLWTTDPNVTSAVDAVASGNQAYRKVIRDCNLINHSLNFDDMDTKSEFEFKTTARTVDAQANVGEWGLDGTGSTGLSALPAYTSSSNVLENGA